MMEKFILLFALLLLVNSTNLQTDSFADEVEESPSFLAEIDNIVGSFDTPPEEDTLQMLLDVDPEPEELLADETTNTEAVV